MEEKSSNRLTAAILKDYRLKNIEWQISAYICDSGLGFLEAISFLAEKTASPSHPSALRVFDSVGRRSFLFWFNSLIFWLVICFFLEMEWSATNQGLFCFSTASSGRRLIALPPPPTPHRPLKLQIKYGRSDKQCELLTLARPNKTPALQAINKMLALFKKFIVYTSTRNEIKQMWENISH